MDRDFLLRFFQSQGLATVADLQDVGAFEPLADYLRTSLEACQKKQGYEAAKSNAPAKALEQCILRSCTYLELFMRLLLGVVTDETVSLSYLHAISFTTEGNCGSF